MNTFLVPPWLYIIMYFAYARHVQYDENDLLAIQQVYRTMIELLRDLKNEERNILMRQVYRYAYGWALRQEYAIREILKHDVVLFGSLQMN